MRTEQLDRRKRIVRDRWSFERNPHGPGWMLRIRPFKRGAGYRAFDLPGYRPSIHASWWRRHAYIKGRTIVIAHRVRTTGENQVHRRFYASIKTNGNPKWFPGWW